MRSVDPKNAPALPKQQVQLNAKHPIIVSINKLRLADPQNEFARESITQVFDNALIQAGLLEDGRSMVPRINKLLENLLNEKSNNIPKADTTTDSSTDSPTEEDPFKA